MVNPPRNERMVSFQLHQMLMPSRRLPQWVPAEREINDVSILSQYVYALQKTNAPPHIPIPLMLSIRTTLHLPTPPVPVPQAKHQLPRPSTQS